MDNNQSWNNPSNNLGNQTMVNDSKVLEKLDRLIEIGNSQEATLEKLYQMFVVEKNVLNDKKEEIIDKSEEVVEPIVEDTSLPEVPETIEQTEVISEPVIEEQQTNIEVPEVETESVDNTTNSDSLLGIDAILNSVPAEQTNDQKVEEITAVPEVPNISLPETPVVPEMVEQVSEVPSVEQNTVVENTNANEMEQKVEEVPSIDLSMPTPVPEVEPVMDLPVSVETPQVEAPAEPVVNEQPVVAPTVEPVVAPVAPVSPAPAVVEQAQIQPAVVPQTEVNNTPIQAEPEYTIDNIIVTDAVATASSQRNTIVSSDEQQRLSNAFNSTQEMNNISNSPALTNTLNLVA